MLGDKSDILFTESVKKYITKLLLITIDTRQKLIEILDVKSIKYFHPKKMENKKVRNSIISQLSIETASTSVRRKPAII